MGGIFINTDFEENTNGAKKINYELCTDPKYCNFIQILQRKQTVLKNKAEIK